MDLNLDELESAPARKKSGRGGLVMLLLGVALGIAGTLLLPRYVTPLLPESLRGGGEQVDGVVLAMGRDDDKLLITVDTPKGAVLATFTRQVAEVELLVTVGDTLTLGMERYDPFVNDPAIAAVRKDRSLAGVDGAAGASVDPADSPTEDSFPGAEAADAETEADGGAPAGGDEAGIDMEDADASESEATDAVRIDTSGAGRAAVEQAGATAD